MKKENSKAFWDLKEYLIYGFHIGLKGEIKNVVGVDLSFDKPDKCHLIIDNTSRDHLNTNIDKILKLIFN